MAYTDIDRKKDLGMADFQVKSPKTNKKGLMDRQHMIFKPKKKETCQTKTEQQRKINKNIVTEK